MNTFSPKQKIGILSLVILGLSLVSLLSTGHLNMSQLSSSVLDGSDYTCTENDQKRNTHEYTLAFQKKEQLDNKLKIASGEVSVLEQNIKNHKKTITSQEKILLQQKTLIHELNKYISKNCTPPKTSQERAICTQKKEQKINLEQNIKSITDTIKSLNKLINQINGQIKQKKSNISTWTKQIEKYTNFIKNYEACDKYLQNKLTITSPLMSGEVTMSGEVGKRVELYKFSMTIPAPAKAEINQIAFDIAFGEGSIELEDWYVTENSTTTSIYPCKLEDGKQLRCSLENKESGNFGLENGRIQNYFLSAMVKNIQESGSLKIYGIPKEGVLYNGNRRDSNNQTTVQKTIMQTAIVGGYIRVISPNGGEVYNGGPVEIKWEGGVGKDSYQRILIELHNSAGFVGWIAGNQLPNSSYVWDGKTLCQSVGMQDNVCSSPFTVVAGQYKIYLGKHGGYNNFMYDISDGFFTINPVAQAMTATAISNASGSIATITNAGSGYTSAPVVTVTGGTCSNRPIATATISTTGTVTSIILSTINPSPTGIPNCTSAPILTIAAPPSTPITPTCGNGIREIPEECDDGNTNNDDSCYNSCKNRVLITCTDSDGGLNYNTKGQVTLSTGTIGMDVCLSTTTLSESTCNPDTTLDGTVANMYICPNGCIDGACKPVETGVCTSLTFTPAFVSQGGKIEYTCTGTNARSYLVTVRKTESQEIVGTFSTSTGSFIIPENTFGTYSVDCVINGGDSTCTNHVQSFDGRPSIVLQDPSTSWQEYFFLYNDGLSPSYLNGYGLLFRMNVPAKMIVTKMIVKVVDEGKFIESVGFTDSTGHFTTKTVVDGKVIFDNLSEMPGESLPTFIPNYTKKSSFGSGSQATITLESIEYTDGTTSRVLPIEKGRTTKLIGFSPSIRPDTIPAYFKNGEVNLGNFTYANSIWGNTYQILEIPIEFDLTNGHNIIIENELKLVGNDGNIIPSSTRWINTSTNKKQAIITLSSPYNITKGVNHFFTLLAAVNNGAIGDKIKINIGYNQKDLILVDTTGGSNLALRGDAFGISSVENTLTYKD